ncbi:hypothetical protein EIQ00_05785 [Xanthomonas campestris pv. raphani]
MNQGNVSAACAEYDRNSGRQHLSRRSALARDEAVPVMASSRASALLRRRTAAGMLEHQTRHQDLSARPVRRRPRCNLGFIRASTTWERARAR